MRGRLNLNPSWSRQQEAREVEASGVVVVKGHLQSEAFPLSRRRFCHFTTMAKIWSLGVVFVISIIIVLVILGESVSNGQRSRSKVTVKKKKTTTTPPPTTIKPPLTLVSANESPSSTPKMERSMEAANVFVHTVTYTTGKSIPHRGPTASREEGAHRDHPLEFDARENYYRNSIVSDSNDDDRGSDICPPKCDRENCAPTLPCPLGHVLDRCSCCHVCAIGEGGRCYNVTSPNSVKVSLEYGICGPGLVCLSRLDLRPNEPSEALCVCRNTGYVCGNDNVTYSSECKLREAAHPKPGLVTSYWTPCVAAPWVTTAAENVTGAVGTDASISCEFRSFPSAVVHWEFSPEGSSERIILPGNKELSSEELII